MGSGLSIGELLATENDAAEALKTIIAWIRQIIERNTHQLEWHATTWNSWRYLQEKWHSVLLTSWIQVKQCCHTCYCSLPAKSKNYASYSGNGCTLLRWGIHVCHPHPEPPSICYQQGQVTHASLDWQSSALYTTYLHPFRSIAYVDGMAVEFFEAAPMRCQLLGWWVDKSWGFRLEDPMTHLLIASL
jgi:hypothetical protein